ncbi:MAG: TetR family transcriptional regulator C-terminal domain-containing protein [Alphaproteobacteria bacterium]|nr:TetR family transcriptional regulator C-terminal domain-containing protein [Alphaproteobacteria bacterium]
MTKADARLFESGAVSLDSAGRAPAPMALQKDAPKSRIRRRNEAKILDAAQDVFAERGFAGASVDEIAARAGMSKPNLHYYYRRKKDVYQAVLLRILTIWLDPLEELNPAADPQSELRRYIHLKLDASRRHPTASRVFATEIIQGAPILQDYLAGPLRRLVARKADVINAWIAQGKLRPIDPYHLIFTIWAATQHYADFAPQVRAVLGIDDVSEGVFDRAEESLCGLLFDGLTPRTSEPGD